MKNKNKILIVLFWFDVLFQFKNERRVTKLVNNLLLLFKIQNKMASLATFFHF